MEIAIRLYRYPRSATGHRYLLYITYINGACFAGRHCRSGFWRGPLAAARSAYGRCLAHVPESERLLEPAPGLSEDPAPAFPPKSGHLIPPERRQPKPPLTDPRRGGPPPPVISPRLSPTGQQNKPPLADKNRVVTLTRSSPSPPGEGGYSRLSPLSASPPPWKKMGTLGGVPCLPRSTVWDVLGRRELYSTTAAGEDRALPSPLPSPAADAAGSHRQNPLDG